jgi:hypothetical protein
MERFSQISPDFAFKPDLLLTLRRGRDLMHR